MQPLQVVAVAVLNGSGVVMIPLRKLFNIIHNTWKYAYHTWMILLLGIVLFPMSAIKKITTNLVA
jgi:hypothetical protein